MKIRIAPGLNIKLTSKGNIKVKVLAQTIFKKKLEGKKK